MEKLVYLAWKEPALAIEAYRERLIEAVAPRLFDAGGRTLDVNVSDLLGSIPKPMLLLGEGAALSAAVSLWLDCCGARGPLETLLREGTSRLDGYLVTGSIPQPCPDRDWPDGDILRS